jgi:hypothetical protein
MAGPDPAIFRHTVLDQMAGSSPAMTAESLMRVPAITDTRGEKHQPIIGETG